MESIAFPGLRALRPTDLLRPATNGTGHQEETGIIGNDHPSIISIMRAPGRTSCSLRIFFDVVGECAFPGSCLLRAMDLLPPATNGTGHRGNQAPSATIIHHISNEGTRRMSCSLRIFFDVVGNVTFPGSCMLRAKDLPPATNGTGHQEETGIIGNDHPSINNEGTRANELLTTVLL